MHCELYLSLWSNCYVVQTSHMEKERCAEVTFETGTRHSTGLFLVKPHRQSKFRYKKYFGGLQGRFGVMGEWKNVHDPISFLCMSVKRERGIWEGIEQTNISLTIVLELTRLYYLVNQVQQEIYNG